jgi:hypothetical protein
METPPETTPESHETQQEEASDEEEHPVIDPDGRPFMAQVTHQDLIHGVDMESETPEEAHAENHPTPDRPGGRVGP